MDKIREKFTVIRNQVDVANAKVQELEAKLKEIQQEHTLQEREIVSLNNKNKQLELDLETAHDTIKDLKGNEADDNDYKLEHENSKHKIALLEKELEDSDNALKETATNFREADVKVEQLEKKVEQLTIKSNDEEKKNKHLEEKNKELSEQLEEINKQLDDM